MLELKGIYKTFNPGSPNEKRALNGVDLVLEDGDFVTIIGGNGAGKSIVFSALHQNSNHQEDCHQDHQSAQDSNQYFHFSLLFRD